MPIVLSPIVLAFGYVVAIGPVGFASLAVKGLFGFVPWNLYSLTSLIVIAGLSHVPHVYLFSSASLRKLNLELEEPARIGRRAMAGRADHKPAAGLAGARL